MRVLIVGCGYVGQAVGAALARQGHTVWGLRRARESTSELQALGLQPVVADITRPETLSPVPVAYDWVVHCVASAGGTAEQYRSLYLQGTKNLLQWLQPAPPVRLVYTSSTSVYGQTNGEWVDETSPTEPAADTGRVLLETERVLLDAAAVVLRVAGIYGPARGYWLKQFLAGKATLENGGARFLNMIHRDDVAGAVLAALERGQPGQVYNAVDDEPVTQRALFEWLAIQLSRPFPPESAAVEAPRKRGFTNKRVSNRRLRTELAYTLKYPSFRQGMLGIQR